jgi:hypothetical protein
MEGAINKFGKKEMATRPFTGSLAPYGEGDIKQGAVGMKAMTMGGA